MGKLRVLLRAGRTYSKDTFEKTRHFEVTLLIPKKQEKIKRRIKTGFREWDKEMFIWKIILVLKRLTTKNQTYGLK